MHGKQSTSWVASYDKNYVVLMMVTQAGTGSGTSGPAVRKIWEALYGVKGMKVNTAKAALPGAKPPSGAAGLRPRRRDPPADDRRAPAEGEQAMSVVAVRPRPSARSAHAVRAPPPGSRPPASTGC